MARVLVVDDDPTVREVVVSYLRAAEHEVIESADGESVEGLLRDHPADLVVLDLMLPGIDGLEVCRRLRGHQRRAGHHADGARLRDRPRGRASSRAPTTTSPSPSARASWCCASTSVLRRAGERTQPEVGRLEDGDLVVDLARHEATRDGRPLALTAREFDLLRFLVANPGTAYSREDLLQQVWGWSFGDQSTVTVHVRRLREKVERDSTIPDAARDRLGRRLPMGARE